MRNVCHVSLQFLNVKFVSLWLKERLSMHYCHCHCSRYYKLSVVVMCFIIPTLVPWYFWDESLWVAYFIPGLLRYALVLNSSWLVNSAAHMWGMRPFDLNINPRENRFVAFSAIGRSILNTCSFCGYASHHLLLDPCTWNV